MWVKCKCKGPPRGRCAGASRSRLPAVRVPTPNHKPTRSSLPTSMFPRPPHAPDAVPASPAFCAHDRAHSGRGRHVRLSTARASRPAAKSSREKNRMYACAAATSASGAGATRASLNKYHWSDSSFRANAV